MVCDDLRAFGERLCTRIGAGAVFEWHATEAIPDGSVVIVEWDLLSSSAEWARLREALRRSCFALVIGHSAGLGVEPESTLRDSLAEMLGVGPWFVGRCPPNGSADVLAVVPPDDAAQPAPAPETFRVAAVMTAFNERDIIRPSIERLISQGIEVYLIDNWSQDGTASLVQDLVGSGLIRVEVFPPDGRSPDYEWTMLLEHVADVAATLDHDWIIHHDVDQRRESPWPRFGYRDALYLVDQCGYNAVDHTILEFRPTDDRFVDGTEPSEHLRHFEFVPAAATAVHVQAWKNSRQRVDLAGSGGHDVRFPGRRVFPFNFVLRHYPIRSQRHGDLKVFRDRKPRYRSDELDKGWHFHYATMRTGHSFVRDPADLIERDEEGAFRRIEEEVVRKVSGESGSVIATGGGAVLSGANRAALRRNGRVYWLDRPLADLPREGRPLSKDLGRLYEERRPLYGETADARIDASRGVLPAARAILEEFHAHTGA
ncbi:MAG: glycosyltransferase [Dehalococcoidia bacterium]|nr:glycosyltransferase [Dehalococcoidia bacterium]